jgi:ribosome-associated protein
MPDPIFIQGGVLIPAEAIEMRTVRSSGPGGENVNKVASKVELRVDLMRIRGLDAASRQRLMRLVSKRLDKDGNLLVTSQRTREQHRNLDDARRKIHRLVSLALIPEKKRVATTPGKGSEERRLRKKKEQSARKQSRRRPLLDEEDEVLNE